MIGRLMILACMIISLIAPALLEAIACSAAVNSFQVVLRLLKIVSSPVFTDPFIQLLLRFCRRFYIMERERYLPFVQPAHRFSWYRSSGIRILLPGHDSEIRKGWFCFHDPSRSSITSGVSFASCPALSGYRATAIFSGAMIAVISHSFLMHQAML